MILNYWERNTAGYDSGNALLCGELQEGRVLVDGKEIKQVWYVDTLLGIVKTLDVLGDGKAHAVSNEYMATRCESWSDLDTVQLLRGVPSSIYLASDFPGREIEAPIDGVLSETLRGRVELFRADGTRIV